MSFLYTHAPPFTWLYLLFVICHQPISQSNEPDNTPEQRQAQLLQNRLSPHELAYQESLIQEREQEIRDIETGIHELAEIFQDLGTLVNQQGDMLGIYFHSSIFKQEY
jgi:syntaxin 7